MKDLLGRIGIVVLVVCFASALVWGTIWKAARHIQEGEEVERRDAYLKGQIANRAGVPSGANPYIGRPQGQSWLDGWIIEELKKPKEQ